MFLILLQGAVVLPDLYQRQSQTQRRNEWLSYICIGVFTAACCVSSIRLNTVTFFLRQKPLRSGDEIKIVVLQFSFKDFLVAIFWKLFQMITHKSQMIAWRKSDVTVSVGSLICLKCIRQFISTQLIFSFIYAALSLSELLLFLLRLPLHKVSGWMHEVQTLVLWWFEKSRPKSDPRSERFWLI